MTIAFPYKTASGDAVRLGDWILLQNNDEPNPVADSIPGWDYDTKLELFRRIEISPPVLLSQTGLSGHDIDLWVNVIASTGPSSYRRLVLSKAVPVAESWKEEVRVTLDSRELAVSVTLRTELILKSAITHDMPFVASAAGSRLYQEVVKIQLEGSLARFPMEMVNFRGSLPGLYADDALWHLDWDPTRPEARFLGAVLLYINAANREFAETVRAMDPIITSVLRCEVIRTMCAGMLQNDEFVAGIHHYDADTVGGQVRDWLVHAFGDSSTDVLRTMLQNTPGRFEARIQNSFS